MGAIYSQSVTPVAVVRIFSESPASIMIRARLHLEEWKQILTSSIVVRHESIYTMPAREGTIDGTIYGNLLNCTTKTLAIDFRCLADYGSSTLITGITVAKDGAREWPYRYRLLTLLKCFSYIYTCPSTYIYFIQQQIIQLFVD